MKSKLLLWATIIFTTAVVVDLITINSTKKNSFSKLNSYVKEHFEKSVDILSSKSFINSLDKKEGSIAEFEMFENKIEYFSEHQLKVNLQTGNRDLFWTANTGFNDVCRDTSVNQYKIKVCFNLFNNEGKLYAGIAKNFNVIKSVTLSDDSNDFLDFGQGKIMVESGKTIRAGWLLLIILSLYLISIFLTAYHFRDKPIVLILFLVSIRALIFILPLEDHFLPLQIFNNENGFSLINRNIADYLINSSIVFVLSVIFSKYILRFGNKLNKLKLWSALFGCTSMIILMMYNAKQLIFNSNLSFNFDDLSQLSSLEIISLSGLALNCFSLFIFNQSIYNIISRRKIETKVRYGYFGLAVLLSLGLAYLIKIDIPIFWLVTFLSVLVILFDLFSDIKSRNIAWLIWWMIVFSVFLSAILYTYNVQKDLTDRQETLKTKYHFTQENTLKEYQNAFDKIITNGALDQIINKPSNIKYNTSDIAEYIQYKVPKLQSSEIQLLPYDDEGSPLAINQFENIENIKAQIAYFQKVNENWFFDPLENRYWTSYELEKREEGRNIQNIFFGFNKIENDPIESPIAISYFKDQIPLIDQNNLNFEEKLLIKENEAIEKTIYKGANAYVIYQPNLGTYLVSKKTFAGLIKPIALFSLIFTIIGLIILALAVANSFIKILPLSIPLKLRNINSFSLRIQLVIIILIIISFLGIAWVTVTFINDFINNNENRLIESKILSISKDMNLKMREEANFNSSLQILNGSLNAFEAIHRSEIDVFQKNGQKVNHQDKIKLDFLPYYYFNKIKSNYPFTIRNKKGDPNSYFLIKHHSGNDAIISVSSNEELKASKLSIFDFLGSIVNVYVFLFLIAGAISIAVARSISKPLSALGDKMKQLKLGASNEVLEWKGDDEIGALIDNYNNMVAQLEDSAMVLAKTERDMAWREMAKQVAHEIKNPLTPMKLRIQYLEKAMKSNDEDLRPMIKRISETLLLQINNLSEIADSFSNFAQLPTANNEKVSLNEVVETIHDLFRKREDIDIKLVEPIDTIRVYADKNHLIRVLNNLVKNAIEAISDDRKGEIIITLNKNDKNAIIQVSDNGIGIPENLRKKVFTPNFTTKNSGSGLGLAIASNMLETFNARIYFETQTGIGTDFFIEIPLIKPGQDIVELDRVDLG